MRSWEDIAMMESRSFTFKVKEEPKEGKMNKEEHLKSLPTGEFVEVIKANKCEFCIYRGNKPACNGAWCDEGIVKWLSAPHHEPLIACPFCGSEDVRVRKDLYGKSSVRCTKCGVETVGFYTEDDAREMWNKRTEDK